MLRDITIGQYYQTDSVIHRLDPRVKLMGTLIFIITLFWEKACGCIWVLPYFWRQSLNCQKCLLNLL